MEFRTVPERVFRLLERIFWEFDDIAARHGTPSPTTLRPWPASRSRRATRSETCACGWTKSRFELFGDTINTASRMESTVIGGRIQVSEETAELIRRGAVARGA